MTAAELIQISNGTHWLCRLAEERDVTPLAKFIDALDIADLSAGEIAVAIMDATAPNGVEAGCKIHLRVYPIEKKMILDAAKGAKLNEFIRGAILEKIMRDRQP
jgi:hypothetical protein